MNSSKLVTRCPFSKPDDPKQHLPIGTMVGRTNSHGSSNFAYKACKVPQFHRLGFPRCRKSLDSETVEVYRDPRQRRQFSWWTSEKSRNGNVPAVAEDKLVSPPETDFCARVPEQHPGLDSNSGTMSTSSPTLSYASVLKRPGEPVKQEVPKNGCRSIAEMSKSCGLLTALLKSGQDEAASEAKSPEASPRKAQKARCSRFSDLKELLGAADLPREPPAAVASPLLSCLVGGLNYGILPSPVKLIEGATLSPKSPLRVDCGNTLIAFIMGTGVDEDSCDEDEDDGDWDVWETQGPSSPVVPEKALAAEVIVEFCEEGVPETVAVDTPDGSCVENWSQKREKNPRSLDEVNRRWKLAYDSVQTSATKKQLVHFAADDRLTVCHEVEWIERKGPWEQMARDKERFKKRIEEASLVIGPILEAQHRSKVCRDRIPQQHCSDNDACLSGFRDATVG